MNGSSIIIIGMLNSIKYVGMMTFIDKYATLLNKHRQTIGENHMTTVQEYKQNTTALKNIFRRSTLLPLAVSAWAVLAVLVAVATGAGINTATELEFPNLY